MQSTTKKMILPGAVDGETGELISAPEWSAPPLPKTPRGLQDGVAPEDLAQAGWGVVFAESDPGMAALRKALAPLLSRRKEQAGALYRDYSGEEGYRAGEDNLDFLAHHGAGPGLVDPSLVPYYLLLVGDPERIPYAFQYGLDLQFAVGRISFDTLDEYRNYADSVVAAETAEPVPEKSVAFFGPRHDEGTAFANDGLLSPMIKSLNGASGCRIRTLLGDGASKQALVDLLESSERPDLLFSATHGLLFRSGRPLQRDRQGALVCQGWLDHSLPPAPEDVLAAADVPDGAHLQGLITFFFACYSAGTPAFSDFAGERTPAALSPFVSKLSQRLLGHPEGGALAVVGHVEQVWRCSFLWREAGFLPQPFIQILYRLLDGKPLGYAMESLSQRFADLTASLNAMRDEKELTGIVDEEKLASLQTAVRDARNYVIVGDPAVRLAGPPAKIRVLRGG